MASQVDLRLQFNDTFAKDTPSPLALMGIPLMRRRREILSRDGSFQAPCQGPWRAPESHERERHEVSVKCRFLTNLEVSKRILERCAFRRFPARCGQVSSWNRRDSGGLRLYAYAGIVCVVGIGLGTQVADVFQRFALDSPFRLRSGRWACSASCLTTWNCSCSVSA